MRYESNILKRLIDTYGVVGNPRYISEIIKEFIVRGKERFPNLFTYQADWLAHIDELGLNPSYTVSYTGQSIYAPNTLERPVKSAILKGQTLVNLIDMNNLNQHDSTTYLVPFTTMKSEITIIATNKTVNKSPKISLFNEDGLWVRNENTSLTNNKIYYKAESGLYAKELVFTITNDDTSYSYESLEQFREQGFVVIEGNYEKDVPSYFEGMQSVKMPVLTTTNCLNLFTKDNTVDDGTNDVFGDFVEAKKNDKFSFNEKYGYGTWTSLAIYNVNKERIYYKYEDSTLIPKTIVLPDDDRIAYVRPRVANNKIDTIMFNRGEVIPYEEYKANKTNILTVNEDVTLRSNGDICDELNLLNGQLTQRIGEDGVVLSQEVVKTVDLTILDQNGQNVKQLMSFNGGTHFNTGSLEGSLLPSVSVTVETDLEETLKVCSLEGNTL